MKLHNNTLYGASDKSIVVKDVEFDNFEHFKSKVHIIDERYGDSSVNGIKFINCYFSSHMLHEMKKYSLHFYYCSFINCCMNEFSDSFRVGNCYLKNCSLDFSVIGHKRAFFNNLINNCSVLHAVFGSFIGNEFGNGHKNVLINIDTDKVIGWHSPVPKNEAFIAYKKAHKNNTWNYGEETDEVIVTLLVPLDAERRNLSGETKVRVSRATVIAIQEIDSNGNLLEGNLDVAFSDHEPSFAYKLNTTIEPLEEFDLSNYTCSTGIHCYLKLDQAKKHIF